MHLADQFRDRPRDKRYLHKSLDVTRSQLLFAHGAVFVEGVTEALLLQRFSEIMGRSLRDHGIEIVVIGSSQGLDRRADRSTNGGAWCGEGPARRVP
jgi:predicted ATP-dependent endonuclease of OLD family